MAAVPTVLFGQRAELMTWLSVFAAHAGLSNTVVAELANATGCDGHRSVRGHDIGKGSTCRSLPGCD